MTEQETKVTESNTGVTDTKNEGADSQESTRKRRYSFESQLNVFRNAITLSQTDEDLKQYAAAYGYNAERIDGLNTLFIETEEAYQEQLSAWAAQRSATLVFWQKRRKANESVRHFVDTARLTFKNDPITYDALGLRGIRHTSYGKWTEQNLYFYKKILSMLDALAKMGSHQVTQEQLEAGEKELKETIAAKAVQENAKAEAQRATGVKSKAWRKLKRAMRKYLNVMREALADDPQMKEKLGIVTPAEE
jgi:hypothetical protein